MNSPWGDPSKKLKYNLAFEYFSWSCAYICILEFTEKEGCELEGEVSHDRLRRTLGRHCWAYLLASSPPSGLVFEWYVDDYPVLVSFFF